MDSVTWPVSTPPSAPTGLVAVAGNGNVILSWSASATATNYYVKRSTTSGSGYTTIATNASLAFTNTGLSNGTLYYFVVSAVNAAGEGVISTEAQRAAHVFGCDANRLYECRHSASAQLAGDHTGWQLQAQTNNLGVGLNTNWSTCPLRC